MLWDVLTGFDAATVITFVIAGLVLNITPGADFMFITANSIAGGVQRGMGAAIGINLGVVVHVLAATAGVSAILLSYPAAYDAIRYAGAAYLVYLAVQAWRASGDIDAGKARATFGRTVLHGFLTNVLNPKTALFIFAFIPQFTDPAIGPVWLQILALGLLFQMNGFFFSIALALAASALSSGLRARANFMNKLTALVFGGLAARLILD